MDIIVKQFVNIKATAEFCCGIDREEIGQWSCSVKNIEKKVMNFMSPGSTDMIMKKTACFVTENSIFII